MSSLISLNCTQVEDMLKYIYGGKIENLEDKATKLLAAADQYDLKLLKKKCEELLCKSLNISNCLVSQQILRLSKLKFPFRNEGHNIFLCNHVKFISLHHLIIDSYHS